MNTVFILGGGVAGLSAAHELAERNFDVVVFERHSICGGKARSMTHVGSGVGGRPDLPAEHGFRFFPGFYWHLTDTMQRIVVDPVTGLTADRNLVPAEEIAIAQDGKPLFKVQASAPRTLPEWVLALRTLVEDPALGIPLKEAQFFVKKIFCFLGSGRQRRLQELEGISWADYLDASNKSKPYNNILVRGLSQSLVAMRPDKASTLTVGTMFVQIVLNILHGRPAAQGSSQHADRVLNAPTNDAWIDPWVAQLRANPKVQILTEHTVQQIDHNASKNVIASVKVKDATGTITTFGDENDFYLSAVPIDVVQKNAALFPPGLKAAAGLMHPSAGGTIGVDALDVEWMSGVLFYMNRDVSASKGHIIYSDSPWALTSISQRQFWRANWPWNTYGNGQVQDILSTIISDWTATGNKVHPIEAKNCTKQQIFEETWAQLKAHLNQAGGGGAVTDADVVDRFLDPAITFDPNPPHKVLDNSEPLLVNTIHSRKHRPGAVTAIPNFFVASDYVLTNTDLACMEAANEAAREAVNGILARANSTEPQCTIRPLEEPQLFRLFQEVDDSEYPIHPMDPPALCRLLDLLLPDGRGPSPFSNPAMILAIIMGVINVIAIGVIAYLLMH
jgi:uncharacterized protein with NAD-binding domain and iron-sulfur cluster